jgi:Domain of unknown function (DUF5753)
MSNEFKWGVVAEFIARLTTAWAAAAPTSYVAVEKLAGEIRERTVQPEGGPVIPLPASTVNDLLTKERHRLPRWEMTASLLIVLREMAAARGVNPDEVIGTLAEWKGRHEAALKAIAAVKRNPGNPSESAESPMALRGIGLTSGKRSPKELSEHRIAVEDGQRATLLELAKRPDARWRIYRGVLPEACEAYLTLERWSSRLQIYDPSGIPDVLQSEEVARHLARHENPGAPPGWLARVVELQMRRQQLLHRRDSARLWVLLDEPALFRHPIPAIGSTVWREQLEFLLALSAMPNISLQIRRSAAAHGTASGPVRLLRFREAVFPDVAYLPQPNGALYPRESIVVHQYTAFLYGQFISAASPAESIEILGGILKRL